MWTVWIGRSFPRRKLPKRVLSNITSGSIVLFHNAALHTPEALPGIIEALQKDGYTLCTVSELIVQGDYTIDSAGVQHPVTTEVGK